MEDFRLQYSLMAFVLMLAGVGCGEVKTNTSPPPSPSSSSGSTPVIEEDPNHPSGNTAIILASEFGGAVGTLNLIPVDPPRNPSTNLQVTHSDAVVRSFEDRIYVINRLGGDNIQVVDPANFETLTQFSTGKKTNPQDFFLISGEKAAITLYEPENNQSPEVAADDLVLVNPQTGALLKTIDLTEYTRDDGDRFARASSMVMVEESLYVAIQDLPGDLALPPNQPGKLLRINTETDEIKAATILDCRDPFTMNYSVEMRKIYIGCLDLFDLSSPYGGIEAVDPDTMQSEGIFLDDLALGGWVGDIEVYGNHGFVIVGRAEKNSVIRFSLNPDDLQLEILYESPKYLPDIAIDQNGNLLIADQDTTVNGIVFLDPETGKILGEPIPVGLPPASITFVER